MQIDLRTLSNVAGRPMAVEVAVERLQQIARGVFSEAVAAIDVNTLTNDPSRFHAAARAVKDALEALRDAEPAGADH